MVSRRAKIAVGIGLSVAALATTVAALKVSASPPPPPNVDIGQKFIEIKAFDSAKDGRFQFVAGDSYTATQLLSEIQGIHDAIGDFNLIRFIRPECAGGAVDPSMTAAEIQAAPGGYAGNANYDWTGNLDSYFTAVQEACGGQIIPDGSMDVLMEVADKNDCKQPASSSAYFQNTASLLQLSAIAGGARYLMLESWDAWYVNNQVMQGDVTSLFQTLQRQGWNGFMPQDNNPGATGAGPSKCSASNAPFPDYGFGGYVRNGLFWVESTPPYLLPHYNTICSIWEAEPYLNGILLGLESQQQAAPADLAYCNGAYNSASSAFAGCLTVDQRETALTSLAEGQVDNRYILIYPVLVGEHQIEYDALQDGTLPFIEGLINQYN